MRSTLRAMVGLVGLFGLATGLGFLIDPRGLGLAFFLAPTTVQGLATMRADFTAFFTTAGAFALYGALRCHSGALLVPLSLFSIALAGRFVSLAADGTPHTAATPMIVEALMIAILLAGRRVFAKPG